MDISKPISNFLNWAATGNNFRTMTTVGTAFASVKTRKIENSLVQMLDKLTLPTIHSGDIDRLHEKYMTAHKCSIFIKSATLACDGLQRLASSDKVAMYKTAKFFHNAAQTLFPIGGAALVYEVSIASQMLAKFDAAFKND